MCEKESHIVPKARITNVKNAQAVPDRTPPQHSLIVPSEFGHILTFGTPSARLALETGLPQYMDDV